jgi:hypothetical protein
MQDEKLTNTIETLSELITYGWLPVASIVLIWLLARAWKRRDRDGHED